ncbi:MAG: hypothetical protein HQK52_11640, partial [Oligoflexia bacterium]|nr:hypothetical protein [Oligoflexia bacterium]
MNAQSVVAEERTKTHLIIANLREIDRLQLFRDLHYPSLFEYVVHELGYSEGAAHRRIVATRMTVELPALDKKIEKGEITLSNINLVKQFINKEEIRQPEEKMALLNLVQGKSGNEAKEELKKAKVLRQSSGKDVLLEKEEKEVKLHCLIDKK